MTEDTNKHHDTINAKSNSTPPIDEGKIEQAINAFRRCGTMGILPNSNMDVLLKLDIPEELKTSIVSMFNAGFTGQTYYDYDNLATPTDTLTIIHFNDVYNVDPSADGQGGFARFAAAIRAYSDRRPLTFFSGDAFNPSMMSIMMRGRQMVPFLNSLNIKTACVGNHDWDFGLDDFERLSGSSNFPWVLSNVTDLDGKVIAGTRKYHLFEYQGHTVGVIGLIEYEWLETCPLIDVEDIRYDHFVLAAEAMVKLLRYKGCNLIVALTHMRSPNDERLSREVQGIDLVLGGHDHHYTGFYRFGDTIAGKSGTDFREFSVLTIKPGVKQADLIALDSNPEGCMDDHLDDSTVMQQSGSMHMENFMDGSTLNWERVDCTQYAPNRHVVKMVDLYAQRMEESMSKRLGYFSTPLDSRFSSIRSQETNIGSYVCDLMRLFTKSDVALLNSGTLRADAIFEAFEPFTLRSLRALLPFPDDLIVIELTGAGIIEALEVGCSMYPKLEGRFLQLSGLRYQMDRSKVPGSRVSGVVTKRWKAVEYEPLDLKATYSVVVKGYMAAGKDGFDCLKGAKVLLDSETCPSLPTMVSNQFEYLSFLNDEKRPQVAQTIKQIAKIRCMTDDQLKAKGFTKTKDRWCLAAYTDKRINFANV